MTTAKNQFIATSQDLPCPHCGPRDSKDSWCYFIGENLSVCKRQMPPAEGWYETSKSDKDGHRYYARIETKKKTTSTNSQKKIWVYPTRTGGKVATFRQDAPGKSKKIWQAQWCEAKNQWVNNLKGISRADIPVYRLEEIRNAIARKQHIFIVEGEKCADALWDIGLAATTNIGGAGKWQPSDSKDLEGAKIIICPDRDRAGIGHAQNLFKEFPDAQFLFPYPEMDWENIPEKSGVDIADWIEDFKLDKKNILESIGKLPGKLGNFFSASEDSETEHKLLQFPSEGLEILEKIQNESTPKFSKPKSQKKQIFETLREKYGDRLRLNLMTKQVELDGKALKPDYLYLQLLDEDIECSKDFASDTFYFFAQKNEYHPVKDYLENVHKKYGATDLLKAPAQKYLGTKNPLYDVFIRKFAIAAVARVFEPGCKAETALILQGRQGIGKSSFFKILAGEWFDDSLSNGISDKDEKLKLHATWIMEWAELESIFSRKDVSNVKAFLSSANDKLRPPFARSVESYPRHSVIVGSTNTNDFLADPTGSRRFWVVPIETVNLSDLKRDRDMFWAAAVHLYKQKEIYYLTQAEENEAISLNATFQRDDTWSDPIKEFCEDLDQVSIKQILEKVLGIELAKQDRQAQVRVADTLRQIGFEKKHTRNGKIWERKERMSHKVTDTDLQGFQCDSSNGSRNNISHNEAVPSDCDSSFEQKSRVTLQTVEQQGSQDAVTLATKISSEKQEEFTISEKDENITENLVFESASNFEQETRVTPQSIEQQEFQDAVAPVTPKKDKQKKEGAPKQNVIFCTGNLVRYNGPKGAMNVTCAGKDLVVKEVDFQERKCKVHAKGWSVEHWISFDHLKKVRNSYFKN